jgi:ubiquinone/menaquinone biosynthesis C-methylase UbiE
MNLLSRIVLSSRMNAGSKIRLVDRILDKNGPPRGGAALEIGCGAGFVSAHVAGSYGMRVTGTDAAEQMIRIAERKNGSSDGLTFMVADAAALPFDDSSFDLVLAQNMMHHVPEWRAVADEVARVVRPGGLFLMSDMSGPSTAMRIFMRAGDDHGFREIDELTGRLAAKGLALASKDSPVEGHDNEFAILFRKA